MGSMKPIGRVWLLIVVGLAAMASLHAVGAAPAGGLEGRWMGEQANSQRADATEAVLIFTQGPGALTGTMRVGAEEMPLFDVKESGTNLSFTLVMPGTPYVSVHYAGTLVGDEIRLVSPEEGHGVFTMTAHRDAPTQTASLSAAPPPAQIGRA